MKGITPVIAVILLLLITIAMVGFSYVFFQRITTSASDAATTSLDSQTDRLAKTISIDNFDNAGNTVSVRNTGTKTLAAGEVVIYVNNVKTVGTCGAIAAGAVIDCTGVVEPCATGETVKAKGPSNEDTWTC